MTSERKAGKGSEREIELVACHRSLVVTGGVLLKVARESDVSVEIFVGKRKGEGGYFLSREIHVQIRFEVRVIKVSRAFAQMPLFYYSLEAERGREKVSALK